MKGTVTVDQCQMEYTCVEWTLVASDRKSGAKRALWRHRNRWEYNIKTDFGKTGYKSTGIDWMHLA